MSKCFYLPNGMRVNGDPQMSEKTKNALMQLGNAVVNMLKKFDKFTPFQNDQERICHGCGEPIKVGFVCRKNEEIYVHNLDCWKKLEEQNKK